MGKSRPRGRSHLAGNVESVDGSRSDHDCPGDCSETSRVAPLQPLTILSCPPQCQFLPSSRPQSAVTPPLGSPPFHSCSGPFFLFHFLFLLPSYLRRLWQQAPRPPVSCPHSPLLSCCLLSEMPFLPRVFLLVIQGLAQKPFPRDCLRLLASPSPGTWCET